MTNRPVTSIRIGREDNVALFERPLINLRESVDKGTELADHHLAIPIRYHRKLVMLLPDPGRHRRTEQHRIHFEPRVFHGIFNNVERHRVDLYIFQRGVVGFDKS